MKTTQNEGNPEGSSTTSGGIIPAGTDVSPDERLLSEAHDAMLTAEDALTEFCGHNDETRGGWALQALTRSIENIRSRVRIAGTSAHPGSHPVGTGSQAQASPKTSQEGSVCEVEALGEVWHNARGFEYIEFQDRTGGVIRLGASSVFDEEWSDWPGRSAIHLYGKSGHDPHLSRSHVASLIAHLTAWMHTGSFDLKGLPSSPPSSEDTELLEWLEESKCDIHSWVNPTEWQISTSQGMREFSATGNHFKTLRAAIRAARAKEAQQASTTSQKGGQGV